MSRRRFASRRARGYTLVELMMALALFTVSMLGIISMQKVVVASNTHSKNLAIAERIARTWGARLQLDATSWTTSTLPATWNTTSQWTRPTYNASLGIGAGFDALGNPLTDSAADLKSASFCTHVRMTELYSPAGTVSGSGMLRAEVRVLWLRDGRSTRSNAASVCPLGDATAIAVGKEVGLYNFAYQTFGLRQHFQI